eukprot:14985.XXX_290006_290215_1 [CDS] Oithona nana genome sequencing.
MGAPLNVNVKQIFSSSGTLFLTYEVPYSCFVFSRMNWQICAELRYRSNPNRCNRYSGIDVFFFKICRSS